MKQELNVEITKVELEHTGSQILLDNPSNAGYGSGCPEFPLSLLKEVHLDENLAIQKIDPGEIITTAPSLIGELNWDLSKGALSPGIFNIATELK